MNFLPPQRSEKPRTRGLTAMIDFGPDEMGWTGPNGLRDLMACAGQFIDFAKIYAMNALIMPENIVRENIVTYRDNDVIPYSGGILFEYAYLNDQVEDMMDHIQRLGIQAVEISENYISLNDEERLNYISSARRRGLLVIWEFGRKNPEKVFVPEEIGQVINETITLGACHVTIEQSELDALKLHSPQEFSVLSEQPWFCQALIEGDPYQFPHQHSEMIRQFGPDVNLANIAAGQCYRLEGLRRGIGRAVDYSMFRPYGL